MLHPVVGTAVKGLKATQRAPSSLRAAHDRSLSAGNASYGVSDPGKANKNTFHLHVLDGGPLLMALPTFPLQQVSLKMRFAALPSCLPDTFLHTEVNGIHEAVNELSRIFQIKCINSIGFTLISFVACKPVSNEHFL